MTRSVTKRDTTIEINGKECQKNEMSFRNKLFLLETFIEEIIIFSDHTHIFAICAAL
jgi:hypothetical protein